MNNMETYYVYVLKSTVVDRNYVGFTANIHKRLKQHNSGKNTSTKPYRPWKLLFSEVYHSKEEALKREKFLKSGQGRIFIKSKIRPPSSTE